MSEIALNLPAAATRPVIERSLDDWPDDLRTELEAAKGNPFIGTTLLDQDDRCRYWEVRLAPGERLKFHHHVLDYFWICHSGGRAISHDFRGHTSQRVYAPGEVRALKYATGEYLIHDLHNVGWQDLTFTTVEFLTSPNTPLTLEI